MCKTRAMSRMPELLLRQWHDQRSHLGLAAAVAVAGDELAAAIFAPVALFVVGSSAILLDVQ